MSEQDELLIVTDDEAGIRIDKVLAARFSEVHSRSYFQYLIESGAVLLNGDAVKKRAEVAAGDEIEVQFIVTPELDIAPEAILLTILFEDESLIVINKPAGLVVHPAPGNWSGTLVNALMHHCSTIVAEKGNLRPGIVHRLDKDTSGVMVAAKTSAAHQKLVELFSTRRVTKEYLAVTVGNPGNRLIDAPIGRHPVRRKEMAVVEEGRLARTRVETLRVQDGLAFCRLFPETGRTHQIRVHLQSVNAPILGDSLYGSERANKRYGVKRQMLHAERLAFPHPITGEDVVFTAPLPEDMIALNICKSVS